MSEIVPPDAAASIEALAAAHAKTTAANANDAGADAAAVSPEEDPFLLLERAVVGAARRLRMAVEFSDMTLSLARAVHGLALAEVAAAQAAALAREASAAEAQSLAEAPSPRPSAAAAAAAAADFDAQPKTGSRSSRAPARPAALDAATLFTRLQATFSQCQEIEAKAEEALGLLEGRLAVARVRHALRLQQAEALRRAQAERDAREAILGWVLPVIDEQAATPEEAQDLHDAAWERVRHDPAYADIREFPPEIFTAYILKDLGLQMDWKRWTPDGWARPEGEGLFPRPRWSPFNIVSRTPILATPEPEEDEHGDNDEGDDPPGRAGWR